MSIDSGRHATMADVARLAGVSVPTVSRVVTGTIKVSADKRERVLAAIAELGFRPSGAARTLASGRSETVAIIAGNTARHGYAETIRGVEEAARAAGFTVMITVVDSADPEEVDRAVTAALNQSIAGVIVLKFDRPGVEALHRIPDRIPVVALSGVRETGVPQAVIDETRGAESLTAHLLELGHSTVHHVRIPPSRREDGRTSGWKRALKKAGRIIPPVLDASWDPRSGREVGRTIAADPTITAVFCGNDEVAMGVIKGLADEGVRVPDEVSVVGFDDHPLAELWSPGLTTVRQDFADLGRRGFGLLTSALAGDTVRFSSGDAELVVRESSAAPAARVRPARGAAANA